WLGEGGCVLRPRTMAPSGGGVVQADAHRHAVVSHHRDRHRRRIISPYSLCLKPKLIVQQYEIWRLVTNFLYFGKWVGLKLALHMKAATAKGTVHESYNGGSFGFVCQLHWKSWTCPSVTERAMLRAATVVRVLLWHGLVQWYFLVVCNFEVLISYLTLEGPHANLGSSTMMIKKVCLP
ncbi:unnamed protein product, partial [Musa banksii]